MVPAIVMPQTVILPLAYGWTVTVRDELTHGEFNKMRSRIFTETDSGTLKPNAEKYFDGLVIAYLVDWTLTDAQGQRIDISGLEKKPEALQDVVSNLRQFAAVEVQRAIEAHHARGLAAIEELKKNRVYRTAVANDLVVCRVTGLSWDAVQRLPEHVYDILADDLRRK